MIKEKLKNKMPDIKTLRWLFGKTKGQRLRILFLVLSNSAAAVFSVFFAITSKGLIDSAVAKHKQEMIFYACAMLGLFVLQVVISLLSQIVSSYVSSKLIISMQNNLLNTLLNKEYSSFSSFHSGEILNRMFSDTQVVVGGMVSILPILFYLVISLFSAAGVLVSLAPSFTLLFILVGILAVIATLAFKNKLKALHKKVQEKEDKVRSFLQETLSSLLIIKVFGADKQATDKVGIYQNNLFKSTMKRSVIGAFTGTAMGFVFEGGYFFAMVWGCAGIFAGTLTYGTMAAILQLISKVQSPFASFSSILSSLYALLASSERLIEFEDMPDEEGESTVDRDKQYEKFRSINFENVDFTYGRNEVLKDVSLNINKGDFVSLTGFSGGGKSTLFLLMLGAYHQTKGEIDFLFEDRKLKAGKQTRTMFAYVPQGNYLISGTLRENITFFKHGIEDSDIWNALEIACAKSFVEELPEGLDTKLGEKGHGLSEGQMQRIAVARAVLSGAPILMLDEATSALDDITESQLLKNIAELKNRTCIIVTHRKAALQICNRHFALKDGNISEI